ncbi:MAG TPA: sigma-54 dependent transcriptional regulator [Candidatus Hydrogenedentes bacterium]|nr:sigma-54 dependent transcriptional regulator [Candidatus Hydrogenedentota bacterium]HPG66575.1 sigma-54 dependent transcriptional regulator [Candidatus Hydrogenedentota bacterium]
MKPCIAIIDDERLIRWSLRERLTREGYGVVEADSASAGAALLDREEFSLALIDLKLPDGNGLELLKRAREVSPQSPVIIITAYSTVESAVEALKAGAFDYITKPFNMDELAISVRRAVDTSALYARVSRYVDEEKSRFGLVNIVGESRAIQELRELVARVAEAGLSTILLLGETGVGKDTIARAIHYASQRGDKPFMNITCTALQETLLESELFGYEKGAFTDAKQRKSGLIELANGGTVLLNEIGDMSPKLQAKLLGVLEDKTFKRIGGTSDIAIDVRIIAATNRDLEEALRQGSFREDLYYRLSTVPVFVPPLRDRVEDIPLLAHHFVNMHCRDMNCRPKELSADALGKLARYSWPGNVRELRNVIERAVLLTRGLAIGADDIVLGRSAIAVGGRPAPQGIQLPPAGCVLEDVEKELVRQALDQASGNQTRAAGLLSISRDQIRYKMKKFGFDV